jgi:hypothetical protein
MPKLSEEERNLLEDLERYYYSGKIPHLAVTQKFPNGHEELLGFSTLIEQYISDRLCGESDANSSLQPFASHSRSKKVE